MGDKVTHVMYTDREVDYREWSLFTSCLIISLLGYSTHSSGGLHVVCWPHFNHTLLHTRTQMHTHTVCSPAAIICWHEHTPARALRGVGGLWVGGQVFWQALGSSPCTLGCLSQTPLLSTQGLLYQVSVTIALCLSLQITNRCPSQSW